MAGCIGLEVGPTVVRAVRLERRGTRVQGLASAEAPWSKAAGQGLTEAIAQVQRRLGSRGPVVLGLPTSSAIVATVQPLVINPQRAALAVQFELQQHLPYDVGQAAWHYQWAANGHLRPLPGARPARGAATPTGSAMAPTGRHAVVIAMKQAVLEEQLHACRRAGLSIEAVGVTGLGAANLWLRQHQTDARQGVLLHASGPLLEWIAMTPSSLQVLPVAVPSEGLAYEALLELLRGSWTAVRDQLVDSPATVWLVGDADLLPRLQEGVKQFLPCAVERLIPTPTIAMDSAAVPDPPRFAVACGLALQGFGMAQLPLNLLVERRRAQRAIQIRRAALGVSLASLALTVALGALGMLTTFTRRQAILSHLDEQEHLYKMLRPQVRTLMERQQRQERWLAQLNAVRQEHGRVGRIVHQLGQILPEELWLTTLEISKNGQLSGTLEGYARSFQAVTRLMENLKASGGWTGVKPLATTVTTDPATGKELVAFTVQGDIPLPKASSPSMESAPAE